MASAGGTTAKVTTPDATKGEHHVLPHALPGGNAYLFTAVTGDAWDADRWFCRRSTRARVVSSFEGGADARYVSTGHLLYMRSGTLMAVPFDLGSRAVTGTPVALIEGVMQAVNAPNTDDETGAGQFAMSASGTLLYLDGGVHPLRESSLVWAHLKGCGSTTAGRTSPRLYLPAALARRTKNRGDRRRESVRRVGL